MNAEKIGKLICDGRRKKGMTQSQLAEKINVSDKTVSKWECGNGCPDISLIGDISKVLEIDVLHIINAYILYRFSVTDGLPRFFKFRYFCNFL